MSQHQDRRIWFPTPSWDLPDPRLQSFKRDVQPDFEKKRAELERIRDGEGLAEEGPVETVASTRGYKLLSLKRSARSSGARGRRAPGARSGGRSRDATRSR